MPEPARTEAKSDAPPTLCLHKGNRYWYESGVNFRIVLFNENGLLRSSWAPSEFYSMSAVKCPDSARLNTILCNCRKINFENSA